MSGTPSSVRGVEDFGIIDVAIIDGRGFKEGSHVQLRFRNPKKEIHKTKVVKEVNPKWDEGFVFSGNNDQPITITAKDHKKLGSGENLGEVTFIPREHQGTEFWMSLGNGAEIHLKASFKPSDGISVRSSRYSPFGKRK